MATHSSFEFSINHIDFDENYRPADNTRITTNFANLARGDSRRENLRNTLRMIDNRFNALARWDNPKGDRYTVELKIISVEMRIDAAGNNDVFPLIASSRHAWKGGLLRARRAAALSPIGRGG